MVDPNPNYPILVEGWRGAVRHGEHDSLTPQTTVERLVESAFMVNPVLPIPEPHQPYTPHELRRPRAA